MLEKMRKMLYTRFVHYLCTKKELIYKSKSDVST